MTNLRGERLPKKRNFLVKIFQNMPKNAFFGLFFEKLACGAENFSQNKIRMLFWESSENQIS